MTEPQQNTTIPPDLFDLLCCPACHGALELVTQGCRCTACHRVFPLRNGIPDFVLPASPDESE